MESILKCECILSYTALDSDPTNQLHLEKLYGKKELRKKKNSKFLF